MSSIVGSVQLACINGDRFYLDEFSDVRLITHYQWMQGKCFATGVGRFSNQTFGCWKWRSGWEKESATFSLSKQPLARPLLRAKLSVQHRQHLARQFTSGVGGRLLNPLRISYADGE